MVLARSDNAPPLTAELAPHMHAQQPTLKKLCDVTPACMEVSMLSIPVAPSCARIPSMAGPLPSW